MEVHGSDGTEAGSRSSKYVNPTRLNFHWNWQIYGVCFHASMLSHAELRPLSPVQFVKYKAAT